MLCIMFVDVVVDGYFVLSMTVVALLVVGDFLCVGGITQETSIN